jgi:hypothetical protein
LGRVDDVDDLQLELPTGALIAGDAAALFADARPLLVGLPTGRFPATCADGRLEVRLTSAEPVGWSEPVELPTPSGYAALLDAEALAAYTDLGDEPVDEFELLAERFAGGDAVVFRGVLAVRGGSGAEPGSGLGPESGGGSGKAWLSLGRDANGVISRISLSFAADGRGE